MLAAVVKRCREQGAHLVMVTATVRHRQGQTLQQIGDALNRSWREITAQRCWKELTSGTVKRVEVTRSKRNGWHPHIHCIVAMRKGVRIEDLRALAGLWLETVHDVSDAQTPTEGVGWHVSKVPETAGGRYLGDAFGRELTDCGRKQAVFADSWTLADIARDAGLGNAQSKALWVEFAKWSHGKRALQYSRTLLRVRREVEGMEDEEARKTWDESIMFALTPGSWGQVSRFSWGIRAIELALRQICASTISTHGLRPIPPDDSLPPGTRTACAGYPRPKPKTREGRPSQAFGAWRVEGR